MDDANWLGVTDEELASGLIARGYVTFNLLTNRPTGQIVSNAVDEVRALSPQLRNGFKHWWETGVVPVLPPVEGYTLQNLMSGEEKTTRMSPLGAFLTLDWIAREPEEALAHLKHGSRRLGRAGESVNR